MTRKIPLKHRFALISLIVFVPPGCARRDAVDDDHLNQAHSTDIGASNKLNNEDLEKYATNYVN